MTSAVLVLNCGSSSVKFALIEPESGDREFTGLAERVGTPDVSVRFEVEGTRTVIDSLDDPSHRGVIDVVLERMREWARPHGVHVVAVGHRVVHGGEKFASSVVLDDAAMAAVRECVPLAPLHNPANIVGIEATQAALPDIKQVGVFDTAFHQTMPDEAFRYAVPEDWYTDYGVRRYGFHGTSHMYVAEKAALLDGRPLDQLRIITAHLGNGCSLAAVKGGKSVDTSMGLTPLEGLVMGTRSGDVDPGVLTFMAKASGANATEINDALNKKSGLLGLSGTSNDMRAVMQAAEDGDARAQLALDVFEYRLAKYIASLVVPLGGLDILVFTGGIGENSVETRERVLRKLEFLGLHVDTEANNVRGKAARVTSEGQVAAWVVPTDEELVIARDAYRLSR